VLVDSGSSTDIIYWDASKTMQLVGEQLQPYHGTLVGFAGEQAEVMGHITVLTTFGDKENAKTIKVRYLVVRTLCAPYNIIIGRPEFNALGAAMSTLYLAIKYPLDNGGVGMVRGDQILARQCYESNLKIRKQQTPISAAQIKHTTNMTEAADLDLGEEHKEDRVSAMGELEEIREKAHIREFAMKQRISHKYNTKVIPRSFKGGDLVFKRPMGKDKGVKLAPSWEGSFRIQEAYGNRAYMLETLQGKTLPRTWNMMNLKFYYS
jgi:hypothetical protein